jgi:hypothetical protein
LDNLYELAGFADIVSAGEAQKIAAAMSDTVALWSNDHRFLSEASLRKRWAKRGLFRGIRGDFLKEKTRQSIDSAGQIVNLGVARWTSSFGE